MGVYKRKDSPYFWLWIPPRRVEGKRVGKGTRERTNVLALPDNRPLAQKLFESRMHALALDTHFTTPPRPIGNRDDTAGWTYIYFATDGEQIKIGRAVNVVARLRSMQTSHPKRITIIATLLAHVSIERLIHRKFSHLRTSGEWFQLAPEIQSFIEDVRAGREVVSGLTAAFALPVHSRATHARFMVLKTAR